LPIGFINYKTKRGFKVATNYLNVEEIFKGYFFKKVFTDEEGKLFENGVGMYAVYSYKRLVGYATDYTAAEKMYKLYMANK
jgi:hypothetical protein